MDNFYHCKELAFKIILYSRLRARRLLLLVCLIIFFVFFYEKFWLGKFKVMLGNAKEGRLRRLF